MHYPSARTYRLEPGKDIEALTCCGVAAINGSFPGQAFMCISKGFASPVPSSLQ
jgi:hypothetical protein